MDKRDENQRKIRELVTEMLEIRDKPHSAEWNTLRAKFAITIWNYTTGVYGSVVNECGVEIMETLEGILKNFSPDKGDCIHYINTSIKNLIRKQKEKMRVEEVRKGIKLPEKKIKTLKRLCESFGKDIRSPEVQKWLAETQGLPLGDVRCLLQADNEYRVLSENQVAADEEGEVSMFDSLVIQNPDNEVEMMEELRPIFSCIQQIWMESQERTRDYLSALVTRQILSENCFILDAKLVPTLREYAFCNSSILEKYLDDRLPSQEEVAEQFGKHKSDASRSMKKFQEEFTRRMRKSVNLK